MNNELETAIKTFNERLECCPFCGNKAEIHLAFLSKYMVSCTKCGGCMLYTKEEKAEPITQFWELVKQWNNRIIT